MKTIWGKKQSSMFKIPNYSKEYIRKPTILKMLGNLKGKKILEIGCGSGYFTRLFAEKGAICTGIDTEKNQLNIAIKKEKQKPLGIKYLKKNATNLQCFKDNTFDIVFLEFVLLEIPKLLLIKKIFKEIYRVLKRKGIIFISEMHPFDPFMDKNSKFEFSKRFNYFSSGCKMIAKAIQLDRKIIKFTDYHWTLEDYFSSLIDAGFIITSLKEPKPTDRIIKKVPYLKYRKDIVKEIIITAKKL